MRHRDQGTTLTTRRNLYRSIAAGLKLCAGATVCAFAFCAPSFAATESGTDTTIRTVLETFRNMPGCSRAGIALGINIDGRQSIYTTGTVDYPDGHSEPVSAATEFQIGSVTKTYTATIYAQLVAEGKLKPAQLLRDLLPAGTPVPSFKDPVSGEVTEITVDELAHHTSGLPRQQAIGSSPFTDDRMLAQLDRITLKTKPGVKYLDSQLGIALLAKAIERVTGQSLASLIAARITEPMHLDHTRLFADSDIHLPVGMDRANQPTERMNIGWPAYEGSSALVSTLDDMMAFMSANMGRAEPTGPVARVLPLLQNWQTVPCATPQEGGQGCASIETGLTWSRLQSKVPGLSTVWKNGMTKGFAAWVGFVAPPSGEASTSGVVALASQASCPVGPLATCALASVNGRPLAPICNPSKLGQ
jgi:CubicO group peptidase (beta-lactamase class C family)